LKKVVLLLLLFPLVLTALSKQTIERKIYLKIIDALLPNKKYVRIWSDDKTIIDELKSVQKIHIVKNPKDADIALVQKSNDTCKADASVCGE